MKTLKVVYSSRGVTVYDVNPGENKYVLKVVRGRDKMTQLRREIHYGTLPGLRKGFHVRVLGYKLGRNSGMYLMDHASFGARDVSVTMTAKEYMKSNHYDPQAFKTAFRKALRRFYRTFNGFHGDLHASNVMVNLRPNNKIKNVILIDYANIVPFEQKKTVQNAFAKIPSNEYEEYPPGSGIQVKWLRVQALNKTGEVPVRSNANMLNKLKNWKPLRKRP
jgi:hypothetical protein